MRVIRPHLLVIALTASACATDQVTGAPASVRFAATPTAVAPTACPAACARHRDRARQQLTRAASGLLYLSESDYPFEFAFAAAPRRGPLDAALLRASFGIAADEPIEVVSLDTFFARHIEHVDPADRTARALVPRYRALKRALHRLTGATVVYRVGRLAIRCYVVGTDAWGNVFGLATTAIET